MGRVLSPGGSVRVARRLLLVAGAGLVLAFAPTGTLAAPATAAAQAGERQGTTVLALRGQAVRSLRAQGVRMRGLAPARTARGRLRLPAVRGAVGSTARLVHRGGLALRGGRNRSVAIRGLSARLGGRSRIHARVAGRRMPLFVVRAPSRRLKLDRSARTVSLTGGRAVLTVRAARRIRRVLRLRRLPAAGFGGLTARAALRERSSDGPSSGPLGKPPTKLARPASAVDVTTASITWHPRDSWIRYSSSGTGRGDGIFATDGATATQSTESACPDTESASDAQLPYAFRFAHLSGWYDEASGKAAIYGRGNARFRWRERTIDLTLSDPEVEINDASSRSIFTFDGEDGTAIESLRAHFLDLQPNPQPTVSADGRTRTYSLVRGAITDQGASAFADFYVPGQPWGCMSVSFTTP